MTEEIFDEKEEIQRCADNGDTEAGRKWCAGIRALPRAWDEQREFLQMAREVRGHGCFDDFWNMKFAMLREIKEEFDRQEIDIPFPTSVHIVKN